MFDQGSQVWKTSQLKLSEELKAVDKLVFDI